MQALQILRSWHAGFSLSAALIKSAHWMALTSGGVWHDEQQAMVPILDQLAWASLLRAGVSHD